MKTVLIAGFESFGGESVNSPQEVVPNLDNTIIGGYHIIARQLPYILGEPLAVLSTVINALPPSLVLAMEQAGGRTNVTVERATINVDDACTADSQGQQPVNVPIVVDGSAARFSMLPIKAMVIVIRNARIPAPASQVTSIFVCNHVMYDLLHKLYDVPAVKGGFIHIPYLLQQAVRRPEAPSMTVETVRRVLEIAVAIALQAESGITVTGGVAH